MRLFISHASEDKPDFVEPLAAALEEHYDIWLDSNELRIGDSLLRKINQGLSSCDFGVVVLSPNFFAKEWPQAELDGLFALETSTRKVILPVWKDIGKADVTVFSPILAGRLAVKAADGIPKVVEAIRLAVDASARQRELAALDAAAQRLRGLDETLTERRRSGILLNSGEGASLVTEAARLICAAIRSTLTDVAATSDTLNFEFRVGNAVTLSVRGPFRLNLHSTLRSIATNSAASARLALTVFKEMDLREDGQFESVSKRDFMPSFRLTRQVVWKLVEGDEERTLNADEVVADAIDLFCSEIDRVALRA